MKYALSIMSILLVLLVCGTAVVSAEIMQGKDRVDIVQETVYGDRSAAYGVTMDMESSYLRQLFWNTSYKEGEIPETYTRYRFYDIPQENKYNFESDPFELRDDIKYGYDRDINWGLAKAYNELYDQVKPGEEKELEVSLGDYYDYYPLAVFVHIPNNYLGWSSDVLYSGDEALIDQYGWHAAAFNEYFKIPVLPSERVNISISKSIYGNSVGIGGGSSGEDSFSLTSQSVQTENAMYFVFDAHTQNRNLVDTSLIPGGFGIYKLPFVVSGKDMDIRVDGLETVYGIDPNTHIVELEINDDGTIMYLYTVEKGVFTVTLIDTKNYKQIQKISICELDENNIWCSHMRGNGFLALLIERDRLYVLFEQTDGTYVLDFETAINKQGEDIFYLSNDRITLGYDGNRLVICRAELQSSCNIAMAVYTQDGLEYYGRYTLSLNRGWENRYSVTFAGQDYLTIGFE